MDEPAPRRSSPAAKLENVGPLQPAAMAERVAMLTNGDRAIGVGELPLWNRLEQPRQPSSQWTLSWWALWCVTLGLLIVALLRVFDHDGAVVLIWLNAFTAYVYLPAYAVLGIAIWKRRWILAAASVVVVAFHVAWLAPDFRPATPYRAATTEASPTVRIFYANVLATNEDYQALFDEIAAVDPDVVVLVEYRQPRAPYMRAAPVMQQYVYGTKLHERYAGEVAVFSRLPVSRQQLTYAAGRLVNIVDIEIGDETLRLYALHSHRPLVETPNGYDAYWAGVEPLVAEETEPLVVIGDFNATQHSAVYERLTARRLRSAHTDRGRGYATTWPNGLLPIPPIRIDQALVSPDVECISIAEGVGRGSDHKPLVLDIRVQNTQPGASKSATAH